MECEKYSMILKIVKLISLINNNNKSFNKKYIEKYLTDSLLMNHKAEEAKN